MTRKFLTFTQRAHSRTLAVEAIEDGGSSVDFRMVSPLSDQFLIPVYLFPEGASSSPLKSRYLMLFHFMSPHLSARGFVSSSAFCNRRQAF